MWVGRYIKLEEVCTECGLELSRIEYFISSEWVSLADPGERMLDEEDIARVRLIVELQDRFGVNDEAIPIILNLIDQIHCIQGKAGKGRNKENS